MQPFDVLIIALATWRLAYMVTSEAGPWDVFARLRTRWPLGGLLTCVRCLSVWAAAALWLVYLTPASPVVLLLAISAAALMLASYTGAAHG